MAESKTQFDRSIQARGPLEVLYRQSSSEGLVFPGDLKELEHFAVFRVRDRVFDTKSIRARSAPATKESQNIFLPMPPSLSTSYGVQYQNAEVGLGGKALLSTVTSAVEGIQNLSEGDAVNKLVSAGKSILTDLSNTSAEDIAKAAITTVARIAAESDSPVIQGALSSQNIAANPYQAVFFQAPNFRTHGFSYTLFAKNEAETRTIKEIIRTFKSAMLPSFGAGSLFFNYPKVFEIEFRHNEFLFEIGTSVLTSFEVNYHGDNTPSYFDSTKAPTNVQITMSFQELNVLTSEDVSGTGRTEGKRR